MMTQKQQVLAIIYMLLALTVMASAQELFIPAPTSAEEFLNEQIMQDHNTVGDPNRVYVLQRGGVYLFNGVLTNSGWALRIKAEAGTGQKPIIYLVANASTGTFPTHFFEMEEDLILNDLILVGFIEELPDRIANNPPRLIRARAAGFDLIMDGCVVTESRGEHIRLEQATRVVKITNCVFGNMGDLGTSNLGAGKLIDFRNASCDSAIFVNNTIINFHDRVVRHRQCVAPIAYFKFDHNTLVNSLGYHGTLVLGWLGSEAIISNNLFIDHFIAGADTDAMRQAEFDESGEVDARNGKGKMVWVQTVPNNTTKWTIKNNYYSVSAAVQAFYDAHAEEGVLGEGPALTDHLTGKLGAGVATAFIKEAIELTNRPAPMVNMAEWYRSPSGGNKTKNTPCACWNRATDDYDRRPLTYYLAELNCTYPNTTAAYFGAENNYPVGDLNWYPDLKSRWENGETIPVEEVIVPLLPYDGTYATFVNAQIVADTVAAGGLANRIYEFQRDQYYCANAVFTVPNGKILRLRAATGTGKKPIFYLWETGTGANPTRPPGYFVVLNGGSIEVKDICIAGFYEGEPERVSGVQGTLIRNTAPSSSIVLDGVIFSNTNGNHVRTEQDVAKVKITNSIFANMGALTTSNLGAGKGIDLRDVRVDSLIVINNTFVNYQDRAIRHYTTDATKGVIEYALIDHNTFVNGMGYHGLFSLGNVGSAINIKNNLFVDAFALGEDSTDVTRAAEWANTGEIYKNGNNRITWIFSIPNAVTQWDVSNNYFTISDAGWAFLNDFGFGPAAPLSNHIMGKLGGNAVNAFMQIDLALVNVPRLMTNMMRWYESPAGGNKSKNTPGVVFDVTTDDYDRRIIEFYRDTLDASYSTSSIAYIGADKGYPAGDLNWYPDLKSEWEKGIDQVFAPTVTTETAIAVTSNSARLNGRVKANGLSTKVWFEYGKTTSFEMGTVPAMPRTVSGTEDHLVSASVGGLESNTTYYFRVAGKNDKGTVVGNEMMFRTVKIALIVKTHSASTITANSAILAGAVNANGLTTTVWFEFGITIACEIGKIAAVPETVMETSEQAVTATLTGLELRTWYFYRVVAKNDLGTVAGNMETFQTEGLAPRVTTEQVTLITNNSAVLHATVNANGLKTAVWFEYGKTTSFESGKVTASPDTVMGIGDQAVSATMSGLEFFTTYHYRIIASNDKGVVSGNDQSFTTTLPAYPSIMNVSISVSFPSHAHVADYQTTDYRLVGFPGACNQSISEYLSGVEKTDWKIYWDNGAAEDYAVPFDGSPIFTASVGRGFWLIQKGTWEINTTLNSAPLNDQQEIEIPLHSGWNIITNPYTSTIMWNYIQMCNNMNDPIFGFNGTFYRSANFKPYQGYYLYNSQNLSCLKIPYLLLFRPPSQAPEPAAQPDWQIFVSLLVNDFKDYSAALGSAKQDAQQLSEFKPRITGLVPMLYFSKPDMNGPLNAFATDIRTMNSETESWEMNVQTFSQEFSTLNFSGIKDVPKGLYVYLTDTERGLAQDLRQDSMYQFIAAQVHNNFTVLVSSQKLSEQSINTALPKSFMLGACYPNPFNSMTTVYYEIPKYSWIKLSIYNLRGQQINTLFTGYLDTGRYRTVWDATDASGERIASGIYIIRMESDGFSSVIKTVFTK